METPEIETIDIRSEQIRLGSLIRYCTRCIAFSEDPAERASLFAEHAAFTAELEQLSAT